MARLTMAQALVKFLCHQFIETEGRREPLFAGVWAIFGHGNVAALGQALYEARAALPTYRGHNEQAMAHAAVAFAKASARRRMMVCTTSIGPGATNLVTAAAVAHVNRLPVLLLPGDVFANRRPDPVLQQVEDFGDPTVSANDTLRPVSRYWDRITRPEQILTSLPAAMRVLTDPAQCGPATLCLCQDVQAEAYEYPETFFEDRVHRFHRPGVDPEELTRTARILRTAQRPLLIAGGGVHYSGAADTLERFALRHGVPLAETQAGKGALPHDHPLNLGALGVTGSSAANALAAGADVILAVGTRLQDFTTASRTVFQNPAATLIQLNVNAFDAAKHGSLPLKGDARRGLEDLGELLGAWQTPEAWREQATRAVGEWTHAVNAATAPETGGLPSDAQVLGAVNRFCQPTAVVVCAAGGLPGELHKLWRTPRGGGYHLEYGYSCMGYEIAGGLGVKLAHPQREVIVMVGDGSYLMLNSEIATSVLMGAKLIVVVLDNGGFGCINRLQQASGGEAFNNLFDTLAFDGGTRPEVDFAAHARALGAVAEQVTLLKDLPAALDRARNAPRTAVVVIKTDPVQTTRAGGAWWDVAVPEIPTGAKGKTARQDYERARRQQRLGG
ncbi:MAG: 3D-(3,5/4)-trihydroxycyclohexane-1,2-dione acylhydrolase (decyclizing) [Deltaproteobacteria bacterium]|nr:3D-(3,5/4)-trihydroxycyclohexane-1,2-dione acylhydrolase (decyclizing) [Deltaproteobacteria bacterium]